MSLVYQLIDRVLFGSHRFATPLQSVAQRIIHGPREASFCLDGCEFHCTTAHKYYFERGNYERDLWPIILECATPGSIVYDIGAHFGFWAVRLSWRVRHVYAFEPSQSNLTYLRRNCKLPNITIIPAALGASPGATAFDEAGSMSTVGAGSQMVPMTTVDVFSAENEPPDLILMDVEGHGGEVLRGATAVLAGRPKIFYECHNVDEERVATMILRDNGYAQRTISSRRSYPFHVRA